MANQVWSAGRILPARRLYCWESLPLATSEVVQNNEFQIYITAETWPARINNQYTIKKIKILII